MTNSKPRLNANNKYFIILGTSRQRRKLTDFFPTNILSNGITPLDIVRNLGSTFDSDFNFSKYISLTCRSCFYHIRDLRRIRRYISLSVAKTIGTVLITNRLDYWNTLLYNIASKDILKFQYVQNCLARVVSLVFPFCPTSEISSLPPFSNYALLPIKLFLLENRYIYFPSCLYHPNAESSIHLVFTCCLFPWLKLILGLS
jgi:hypothetical protein